MDKGIPRAVIRGRSPLAEDMFTPEDGEDLELPPSEPAHPRPSRGHVPGAAITESHAQRLAAGRERWRASMTPEEREEHSAKIRAGKARGKARRAAGQSE